MSTSQPIRRLHEQPIQKAARLLREDRVTLLEGVKVYRVVGDGATYDVLAGPEGITCSCPARIPLCSHAIAVMGIRYRCPSPVTEADFEPADCDHADIDPVF